MRKRMRWLSLCVVVLAIYLASRMVSCCCCGPSPPTPDPHRVFCQNKFEFAVDWPQGQCPNEGCGLNGTWLGKDIKFRTLRLDHGLNEHNIMIDSVAKD